MLDIVYVYCKYMKSIKNKIDIKETKKKTEVELKYKKLNNKHIKNYQNITWRKGKVYVYSEIKILFQIINKETN